MLPVNAFSPQTAGCNQPLFRFAYRISQQTIGHKTLVRNAVDHSLDFGPSFRARRTDYSDRLPFDEHRKNISLLDLRFPAEIKSVALNTFHRHWPVPRLALSTTSGRLVPTRPTVSQPRNSHNTDDHCFCHRLTVWIESWNIGQP